MGVYSFCHPFCLNRGLRGEHGRHGRVLGISEFFHNCQVLCKLRTEEIVNFTPLLDENYMHQNHIVTKTLRTIGVNLRKLPRW